MGNWDDAQTVTVSAAENAATGRVTLAHAASGADYGSITADPVVVSVVGVAAQQPPVQVGVSSLTQTLTVPEGGSNSYTVVLGSRPTGDVSIGVTLPAGTDLSLSSATLTFTTGDWDVPQTVTVTAAEDDDAAADPVATLTHTVSGGGYTSTTVPDVEVSITENDTPDIVLSETRLDVTEGDAVGSSYTVALATKPSAGVSVSITGHAGTDLSLDETTLTFTVNDWNTAQTVTVKAGQDDDTVSDAATLRHTASGGDYAGITADLPVAVTDAGDPRVTVQFGAGAYTVSEGDTATITVTLSADPKRTVIIPFVETILGNTTSADYSVQPSVTFNSGETSQTFEFTAVQDDVDDDDESMKLAFGPNLPSRVTKGTPKETMVSIRQMTPQLGSGVTVQFEADAYTVSEGSTATITVTLSADPKSTVIIPLDATGQDGATSDDYHVPSSVTINEGETSTSFNFTATQDDVDENCECVLLTFGALPSGVSAGSTDEAKVSIIDNATSNGPPTVPPGPFDLTIYGRDQALYVQWETPVAEDQRAPVNSYWLRYRQVGTSSWRNVSRANVGLRLWEDITELTNRRAYEVQVAAVNRMGTGAWASVKGTPQAPHALPPGPEGDEAFDLGRLGVNWLHPAANGSNVLEVESCTGAEDFRVIWTGPQGNRNADEWAVHINTRGGAGEVSYSITPRGDYFEMNGTANVEGDSALSLSVRGRFGSAWGTWWSPPVSIYCHEPEAPADTCDLQVQQQAVENTPAEGGPRIDGIPELGQTLSADTTAIADADRLNDVVFNYQWMRDDADIPGTTGSTYTVVSGDVGNAIRVRVDFTDDAGNDESLTSAPTVVTSTGLELRSATVDGSTLTLTYNEVLDNLFRPPEDAFAVNVNGESPHALRRRGGPNQRGAVTVQSGGGGRRLDGGLHRARRRQRHPRHPGPEGRLLRWAGGHECHGYGPGRRGFGPADGQRPRRAVVPQRAGHVHLRAAVQRGPRAGLQLHDGAGPCVQRDRRLGDLCAPAGAGQEPPLGDPRHPRLRLRRGHNPERHHRLLRPGRHLHRGRQDAARWASAARYGAELAGHGRADDLRHRTGGTDPHRLDRWHRRPGRPAQRVHLSVEAVRRRREHLRGDHRA